MTKRKFFKTTYKLEVLSENLIPDEWELNDIISASIYGDLSMQRHDGPVKKLNGKEAAKALRKQGSDPGFFRLDDDGNDIEA